MADEEAEKMGWYGNYVSVSMERTLVLYGEEKTLIPGTIPEFILNASMGMWHFEKDREEIAKACTEGQELAEKIMREHPNILSPLCK